MTDPIDVSTHGPDGHWDYVDKADIQARGKDGMSDLVQQLRNAGPELAREAADCIERLQRELEQQRQRTKEEYEGWRDSAERDQLQRTLAMKEEYFRTRIDLLTDEADRLRAALERLRDACIESNDLVYAAIATEALGPAQETAACICRVGDGPQRDCPVHGENGSAPPVNAEHIRLAMHGDDFPPEET